MSSAGSTACTASAAATASASSVPVAAPQPLRRRRRLWQLPTQAHELLLALSFSPETLRREAARTLGRMQGGICELQGSDADVLYSVVHDLSSRNPLSEGFQKRLDDRHAASVRRCAALRDPERLRSFWTDALAGPDMPAALWVVLTHPLGAELEKPLLYQARAWVFAHTRRSVAGSRAHDAAVARAKSEHQTLDSLRTRLAQQQRDTATALAQSHAECARLRGELARRPEPGEAATVGATARAAGRLGAVMPVEPSVRLRQRPDRMESAAPAAALAPLPKPATTWVAPQPIHISGSRVLCVGGIQHAVSRYRSRIEDLGGDFDHHDGGVEDSAQALDGRLNRADLVICQAGCINHEAYHRIKRHCDRTGTPCLYLDRPSLSRFDRALSELRQG